MNIRKLRNIFIIIGIMVALLPWFMYFIQGSYYGVSFSITTTTGAVAAFIAASLLQAYDYKKRGYPIWYPLILAVGFAALLVYLRFFY